MHWELLVHGCLRPIVSVSFGVFGGHFFLHFFRAELLFLLLHCFLQDLAAASSSPRNEVNPSPARVPATADLKRPRRELSALIRRTSRSNVELSIAFPPCTVVVAALRLHVLRVVSTGDLDTHSRHRPLPSHYCPGFVAVMGARGLLDAFGTDP
jgi:hypothetical protein